MRSVARAALSHVPTGVWLGFGIQTVFMVALAATDGYDAASSGEWFRVIATYVSVASLFGVVHFALGGRPRLERVATFAMYAIFVAVNFARFETTGTFDYGFFHENVRELGTPLGRNIVTAQVKPLEIALFLVVPLVLGVVLWRYPSKRVTMSRRRRTAWALGCAALLVGIPASGIRAHESVSSFAASALRYHAETRRLEATLGQVPFPLVHEFVPSERGRELAGTTPRPHVILLFLESWSAIYGDRVDAAGRPYTPVFDAWRREGLTFDHFYASSVQSSHGRFAVLCALIPLYRGKEADVLSGAPLNCLPRVMADAGYGTFIMSASDEPAFERSEVFFKQIGFSDVRFEDPRDRPNDPRVWGAGLQDDAYYEKLFRVLDQKVAAEPDKPLFTVAINASNHYPFNKNPAHVPVDDRPTKYGRNYIASLRKTDAWLSTFFAELEQRPAFRDAIVVLVGDHSFPADEHGIHFNGLGAREESFRTSFALQWKGHVPPSVVTDRTASQLDIAPTIADLLQIRHQSHFAGRTLLVDDPERTPVPMVQPYDGVRLLAVRYPYKLEVHQAAAHEHLYDLSQDPDEGHDILGDGAHAVEVAALRETIEGIRRSQSILRARRVWPPEPN